MIKQGREEISLTEYRRWCEQEFINLEGTRAALEEG